MRVVDSNLLYQFVEGVIDDTIADAQEKIPIDAPFAWSDWLKRGIENGKYNLDYIVLGEERIGSITWMVTEAKKRELCIIHAYSLRPDLSLVHILALFAERKAREQDCVSVCCHTLRRGLVKQAIKIGWHVSEIILRKNIN